jgi:tetratricopeptide (TPR) repeat protein
VLPHSKGGVLHFRFWNDQKISMLQTFNQLTIGVGKTQHTVKQYTTPLDMEENYKDSSDWGPGGGARIAVPVPKGIDVISFNHIGSQTGFELSDFRYDPAGSGEGTILVEEHVNRTEEVLPAFYRVLHGATSGRAYYGYVSGKVVLPHSKGGVLHFRFWNDQNKDRPETANRLTIVVGETTRIVEQATTKEQIVEFYQGDSHWGPAGGTTVDVSVPVGVTSVQMNHQGSRTGFEVSDLRFTGGRYDPVHEPTPSPGQEGEQKKVLAERLAFEGAELQKAGKYAEAIGKYRESLKVHPDKSIEEHVKKLEEYVKKLEGRTARAECLALEGAELQKAGKYAEAIGKYRESLKVRPDKRIEAHVKKLEEYVKKLKEQAARKERPTPMPEKSGDGRIVQEGDHFYYLVDLSPAGGAKEGPMRIRDGVPFRAESWLRLKSHGEDRHSSSRREISLAFPAVQYVKSVAVYGNLDNSHYLPQGTIIARLTVTTSGGRFLRDIVAGVHFSEWNKRASDRHAAVPSQVGGGQSVAVFDLPGNTTVTGIRFDYVEAPKEYDHSSHAPGFCLRGVTLVLGGSK